MARIPTRRSVTLPDPPDKYDAKDQRETRRILMETLGRPGGLASVTEDNITLTDTETNDVTSTAHGFAPKSPADATKFLNGAATPAYAAVKDSDLATTDVTSNDATDAKHGFLPKLSGNPDEFLNGEGDWAEPVTGRIFPTAFPTISGLELRLSAELSAITHDSQGLVTGVTDISGNARNAVNGSTPGKPRYFKRRFNMEYPALYLDGTNNDHLTVTMPNLAAPVTVVIVCEELAVGTGDGNIYRDQTARAVGYLSGGNSWSIFSGAGFVSTALYSQNRDRVPANGPTALPCVRIDLYNGASSLISNNGTEVTGSISGSGTILGGTFHIGNGVTAVTTAAKFLLYEILVYSVALTTQNRADLMAYYRDALDIPM